MAQNYRNQSGRSDFGRGRSQGSDRDRYRTGGEQRFSPSWDERDASRGYEGDRSYSAGGYPEEFGYRGRNRDDQDRDYRSSSYQNRSSSEANYRGEDQGGGRDYSSVYGRGGSRYEPSRYDQGRFDEANRWSAGEGRDDADELYSPYERDRGTTTSSWHEDQGDRGSYFGTGSYIDDRGASRGFGADFERARAETQRRYGSQGRGTSGDYRNYGRSQYGSQAGYGRDREAQREPSRGQRGDYQARSSWGYGQNRGQYAGSGSTGGGYGYDAGYRSDYGSYAGSQQSHRGRGPQGYQRSDERLKEMICERLTDDPSIDASNVTVEVTSQVVKITGTVDDRSTKYEIEELVESLGGVKDIDNQLRVQSNWSSSNQNQGSSQQTRGGSDWEAGSSNMSSSGTTKSSGTSAGTSTSSSTSPSKRN